MNQLITIGTSEVNNEIKRTVNARDLHAFLKIGRDFSNWMKDRIGQYGFVENQDFVCTPILASEGRGGGNRVDYHLTLDMAKELSMVERNEQGKQARQYFIECERKASNPLEVLSDPATVRNLLLSYTEKVLELEPKARIADRIAVSDGKYGFRNVAKILGVKEPKLRAYLLENGWCYTQKRDGALMGRCDKIAAGLVDHKVTVIRVDGEEQSYTQMFFTPKGLEKLAQAFDAQPQLLQAA